MGRLTEEMIKELQYAEDAPKSYADGGGLYIRLTSTGSKLWRIAYRYGGLQAHMAAGQWPETSLEMARERLAAVKRQLAQGLNPSVIKKRRKEAAQGHKGDDALESRVVELEERVVELSAIVEHLQDAESKTKDAR